MIKKSLVSVPHIVHDGLRYAWCRRAAVMRASDVLAMLSSQNGRVQSMTLFPFFSSGMLPLSVG